MNNSGIIVDAAIFDLDGTLIDSSEVYFTIVEEILQKLDIPSIPRQTLSEIMKKGASSWGDLFPTKPEVWKDRLNKEAGALFKKMAPRMFRDNLQMITGVAETLKHISAKGINIGLVTLTHLKYLDDKLGPLKNAGVAELIEAIICIEDTPRVKPAPDSLIECARRMNVSVDRSTYIGDSDIDIRAGRAAGTKTVGVLTGMSSYETLKKEGADIIIDSVVDLAEMLEPFGTAA